MKRSPYDTARISPNYKWIDDTFTVSGVPINEIMTAAKADSAYIYDAETIKYQYTLLRKALPGNVEIFYAMKANPALAVIQLLHSLGSGIDVASRGELVAVEALDISANGKLAYTAPIKNKKDLEKAVDMGAFINIESLHEAETLSKLAEERNITIEAGLRINPDFHTQNTHLTLSGDASSKFGIDIEELPNVYGQIAQLPNLVINGIHIGWASGVLCEDILLRYYEHCFKVAQHLRGVIAIKRIDMGGGIGIPYFSGESAVNLEKLGAGLQTLIDSYPDLSKARIIIEPGRYLVGAAGIYACKVDHVKESRGNSIIMVEGGIHHYARPALIQKPNPSFNLSRRLPMKRYAIADETATSVGYFGKNLDIAKTTPRDIIGVFNTGSYGLTQSATAFISHDLPPELMIIDGEIHIIRVGKDSSVWLEGQTKLDLLNS